MRKFLKKFIPSLIIIAVLLASYPLSAKAAISNFGLTADNASSQTNSTDRKYVYSATPGSSGTLTSGVARVWLSSAGTSNAKLVIYSDSAGSPSALLASSDQIAITNTSEAAISFTFTGANRISLVSGTAYWIGIHFTDPGVPNFTISRANTLNLVRSDPDTYSDGPADPCSCATSSNGGLDIYLEYDDSPSSPSLIQTVSKNGGGYVNSYTIPLATNVAGGSLLTYCLTAGSANTIASVVDNRGNTWNLLTNVTDERQTWLYYVNSALAGSTTVTITFGATQFADSVSIIREYAGVTATPLDQSATGSDYGSFVQTHTSSSTAVTSQNNELITGCIGTSGSSDPVFVAGAGYGNLRSQNGFDVFTYGGMEDKNVTSTGAQTATFTTTGFVRGQVIVGTWKAVVTGGGGGSTPALPVDVIFFD